MLGVGLRCQKLKPRPKSDLTLGIGLEVWQISWQIILLNLFWYSVTVISPITGRTSAVSGLDGSTRNPPLLKICSFNLESSSSASSSSSNFSCGSFLTTADELGVSVFVWSAWIYLSLAILSILLSLLLWCCFLQGFGSQGLGAQLCWLAGFLAIFWFPTLLGTILGDFGWLAYQSLVWIMFRCSLFSACDT